MKQGFSEAGSSPMFLFHGIRATTQELQMKCHWQKFVQHYCELKLKRTAVINQFVILSFRSSQFVSYEVSLERTHDKKMTPTGPKRSSKSYWKIHYRKDAIKNNTQTFRRLLFICSHDILINLTAFENRKKTRGHMSYSVSGSVLGCRPPVYHISYKNSFLDSKYLVSILPWIQGNHNLGHLWNQIDHNLDHKCPDYRQPVTINIYDQIIISLESCFMYYDRV